MSLGDTPGRLKLVRGMAPTDEDLVLAFQAGDTSAFDLLVRRWDRKIQGAAFRVLGSDDEARDVSQEAFLKAFRSLGAFKREARFSSWLYQIALNLCRDRLRRRKGREMLSLDVLEDGGQGLPGPAPTALDLVQAQDLARVVAAAVRQLSDEQREAVILKEYQGLTFPEISEVLGVPVSTVKTRLYRALSQLKTLLEARGLGDVPPQQERNHGLYDRS
jgi:RNA polymerase sigma-70 factor (ECF subfamily)